MLKSGRYERAMADALILKPLCSHHQIDAVIANAGVRLLRWDELRRLNPVDPVGIDVAVARVLSSCRSDQATFDADLERARNILVPALTAGSMSSYFRLIPVLAQYRLLEEIAEARATGTLEFFPWEQEIPLKPADIERVTAVRCALIDQFCANATERNSRILAQWLHLARFCRKSGDFDLSKSYCHRARRFADERDLTACSFEMAKVYWGLQQNEMALKLLNSLTQHNLVGMSFLNGKIQFLRGKWSRELNSLDAEAIANLYKVPLDISPKELRTEDVIKMCGKAHFTLAAFTDERVTSRLHDSEQMNQETPAGGQNQPPGRGNSRFWASASPKMLGQFLSEQLPHAIENYLKALKYCPVYADEAVPRFLYLFFDIGRYLIKPRTGTDQAQSRNPLRQLPSHLFAPLLAAVEKPFDAGVSEIKTAVWLNAVTQLISRIEQPVHLERRLFQLITFALLEYPMAVFWHLMSVKHSTSGERNIKFQELLGRCLDTCLVNQQEELSRLCGRFERITSELISLSILRTPQEVKEIKASDRCPLLLDFLRDCDFLMPLCSTLNIKPDGPTPAAPHISGLHETITVITSLQRPKRVTFSSTEGGHFQYLVKRDDDLRKDMRMMEFAGFVNGILSQDRQCRQRDLSIPTFAVVCLNEQCGIIEWVENTRAFREIAEGLLKERQMLIPTRDLMDLLFADNDRIDSVTAEEKYRNFVDIVLPRMPPLLHLWLVSSFKEMRQWLQARTTYTRSVAVWSFIGYLLGLGDRHAENVLLNENTGACVHVDFSCLFDKAKSLKIPETVPFRLTRNLVDGMGVMGTDGCFSAAARLVMETLRTKRQKVIAVLNTLVNDPLVEWKRDGQSSERQARLTLDEIDGRLKGLSEDRSAIRSPECVVRELIEQATDNRNLSRMFVGWQAFL
jgi:serine/threonine-protein kinase ATR